MYKLVDDFFAHAGNSTFSSNTETTKDVLERNQIINSF